MWKSLNNKKLTVAKYSINVVYKWSKENNRKCYTQIQSKKTEKNAKRELNDQKSKLKAN